jgi:hypothetical protein
MASSANAMEVDVPAVNVDGLAPQAQSPQAPSHGSHPLIPPDVLTMVNELVGQNASTEQRLAAMANVTKLITALQAPQQVSSGKLRVENCKLPEFRGNSNPQGTVITPDNYLPLLQWLRTCEFALRTARVPESDFAMYVVNNLSGAARHSFMRQHAFSDISTWTYEQVKNAIIALIPDHRALFTETALTMAFSANTLADDVERFALYLQYGELNAQASTLVFRALQQKIHDAAPKLLSHVLIRHGLSLTLKATFAECVADAHALINVAQLDGVLSSPPKASPESKADTPGRSDPRTASKSDPRLRVHKRKNGRNNGGKFGDKKPKLVGNATSSTYAGLAREFGRCTACGWLVEGRNKAIHAASPECKPELLARRMAIVAKLKAEGKDPNAKLLNK